MPETPDATLPPDRTACCVHLIDFSVKDGWVIAALCVEVPLGAIPHKDVVYMPIFMNFDGIKLLEARFTPPPCFGWDTPSQESPDKSELQKEQPVLEEVRGVGDKSS